MDRYTSRDTCRVCSSTKLLPIYTLGDHYISDFVKPGKAYDGLKCPIELVKCSVCTLVQNPHTAPQELLYSGHYWYKSGTTDTMKRALADVVASASARVKLKTGDVVLDIGSNDGTLLRNYSEDLLTIGVEPAKNFAVEGAEGVTIFINNFWNHNSYREAIEEYFDIDRDQSRVWSKAKIITAIGMFYDLEDPNQFISDIRKALHPDGVFVAQLMCLKDMIQMMDVGNMAHEHLEFYTLESLRYLLKNHGLMIEDIETNNVNGQSTRLYIRHSGKVVPNPYVDDLINNELSDLLYDLAEFIDKISLIKSRIKEYIHDLACKQYKKVWIYGASTKGNTLLQWLDLDDWLIGGASERTPSKVGKVTAGSNIMIYSEEEARRRNPDYFLVLPYAFLSEFLEREQIWKHRGGKFIIPLPEFKVIQ